MTNELSELDAVVAGVLGLLESTNGLGQKVWIREEHNYIAAQYPEHLSMDWNALMAAVGKLESTRNYFFQRGDVGWCVVICKPLHEHLEQFIHSPETLALAKCIAAAVRHKEQSK